MAGKSGNKLHEKHQVILANMLREEDNKYCADCHAKGPRWASWNLGVFMCIRCAGIHRNLGVHISRVKSVNLDSWTPEQITSIQNGGNAKAMAKYEANLPANFRRPQDDYGVEQFIRSKYERKLYIGKDPPTVTTTTESRSSPAPSPAKERTTKKKSSESQEKKKEKLLPVPRPQNAQRSQTPPTRPAPSSSPNLISMTTPTVNSTPSSSASPGQPVIDLLTDTNASSNSSSPWQSSPQPPLLGEDPQKAVKQNIMSLYQPQPQTMPGTGQGYQTYTTQGFQVNPYHYQQQQVAAYRMAQQQQMQQMQQITQQQVREVEEKMRQLKMQQGQQPTMANGQPLLQPSQAPQQPSLFPQPGPGGQTLNPGLW